MWCPEILPGIYVKTGTSASEPPPDPLSKAQTMSSSLHPAHFRKKKKSHMQVSCTKPSGIPFSLTTASQGEPSTIISRFPTDETNALHSPHPLLPCCPRFMFWFSSAFSSLQCPFKWQTNIFGFLEWVFAHCLDLSVIFMNFLVLLYIFLCVTGIWRTTPCFP